MFIHGYKLFFTKDQSLKLSHFSCNSRMYPSLGVMKGEIMAKLGNFALLLILDIRDF